MSNGEVCRGQVWEFIAGSRQFRGVVISTDDYNMLPTARPWTVVIVSATNEPPGFTVALQDNDPGWPGLVVLPLLSRVDRTGFRRCVGYLSGETYTTLERGLREFLELP